MSQKDATVIAREIQDMAQAMAESMTSVAETVKAAVAVTHGQARGEAGQIVQLARHWAGDEWTTLTIPRGGSAAHNAAAWGNRDYARRAEPPAK